MALSLYYFPKFLSYAGDFVPRCVEVNENGSQRNVELNKDTRENLKSDIILSTKAGFYLGIWFSSCVFVPMLSIIAELFDLRTQKKIFEAFLPSIQASNSEKY